MDLLKKYNGLSAEGRKGVLFLLAVLAAVIFLMLPSPSSLLRLFPSAKPALPGKPSPWDGRFNAPPPPVLRQRAAPPPPRAVFSNAPPPVIRDYVPPVASPGLPTPGPLLGKFEGKTFLPNSAKMCGVSLELHRAVEHPEQVVAYVTKSCMDPMAIYSQPKTRATARDAVTAIARSYLPESYIFSGTPQAGGVFQLHVEKIVSQPDVCVMQEATLTPFGYRQLAFEWEDTACGKGQMTLTQIGT